MNLLLCKYSDTVSDTASEYSIQFRYCQYLTEYPHFFLQKTSALGTIWHDIDKFYRVISHQPTTNKKRYFYQDYK